MKYKNERKANGAEKEANNEMQHDEEKRWHNTDDEKDSTDW